MKKVGLLHFTINKCVLLLLLLFVVGFKYVLIAFCYFLSLYPPSATYPRFITFHYVFYFVLLVPFDWFCFLGVVLAIVGNSTFEATTIRKKWTTTSMIT